MIGITGAFGFLGWHLRCHLLLADRPTVAAGRKTFADEDLLDEFVRSCSVVVHLAGLNRANSDEELRAGILDPAQRLIEARSRTGASFDVILANSIHAPGSSAYADAKADVAQMLAADARAAGNAFCDLELPHLFGEFGRPFYNSAVSTFAHQLARGETSQVSDGQLQLRYVQEGCEAILQAVDASTDGRVSLTGTPISVRDCYATMSELADYARTGSFPSGLDDPLRLRLFNTIRSQMWPDSYPQALTAHTDARGSFFEAVRAWGQGQTSMSTTLPGITRGDHFHTSKVERFLVVSGEAVIRIRRLFDDRVHEFPVFGTKPCFIDMPTFCTHNITNTGTQELVTLFWSHDHFDPNTPDTVLVPVHTEPGADMVNGEGFPA